MSGKLFDVPETESKGLKPMCGGKRFRELPDRGQQRLIGFSVDELVPADALVRVYDEIINLLDMSALEAHYRGGGAPAYPPRLVVKLLIFALAVGVRSAREIARRCEYDVRFMWLAQGLRLDHELLSDFRTRFREELKALFKQTVVLGVESGLIELRHVCIDGSKIAAHAKRKSLSAESIEKLLNELDEEIERLLQEAAELDAAEDAELGSRRGDEIPQELADARRRRERLQEALKKLHEREWDRISETDQEAPVQKTPDGKRPGYNAQLGVDADSGMVVAQALTDAQNDTQQFAPMLDQAIENAGRKPAAAVADAGYQSAEALKHIEEEPEVDSYIKQQPLPTDDYFGHEDFAYDADNDRFICPGGQELPFKGYKELGGTQCRCYRASARHCQVCPLREKCIGQKRKFRQLVLRPHSHLVAAMRRKLKTEAGKTALKLRWSTAEGTFGTMKAVLGLRQFLLRGLDRAGAELTLCSLAVNVRKLSAWVLNGGDLGGLRAVRLTP
jgi:transposase